MKDISVLLILCAVIFTVVYLLIVATNIVLNDKINDLESRTEIALQDLINSHGGSIKGLCSLHPECKWIGLEPELEGMI